VWLINVILWHVDVVQASSQRGMDRRVVAQLFDCIDDVKNAMRVTGNSSDGSGAGAEEGVSQSEAGEQKKSSGSKHVILIAASNRSVPNENLVISLCHDSLMLFFVHDTTTNRIVIFGYSSCC
jgi:hypothetical protein